MNLEDYFKYYIQGSDHYLIPKDVFIELFDEMVNWREESQKLQTIANNCKQLKDNWDKLKEYCKENTLCYEVGDDENTKLIGSKIHGLNVLDKMQELEKGSDE